MKIWIPKCGDGLRLETPWTFKLYDESRNEKVRKALALPIRTDWKKPRETPADVTFEPGTELVIDRVYIRQDANDFASLTFIIKSHTNEELISERFWAKLDDVNGLEGTFLGSNFPIGFAAKQYKTEARAKKDPSVKVKADKAKAKKKELETVKELFAYELSRFINDGYNWGKRSTGDVNSVINQMSSAEQVAIEQHLSDIVAALVDNDELKERKWRKQYPNSSPSIFDRTRSTRDHQRSLTSAYGAGRWSWPWTIISSKTNPGGTTSRLFIPGSFVYNEPETKRRTGFLVTSNPGGTIIKIECSK